MALVPRFCKSLIVVLSFMALMGLACFNSSVLAQTDNSKPNQSMRVYTIVQASDGSIHCRNATAQEKQAMESGTSPVPALHQINHLISEEKPGQSLDVNGSNPGGLNIYLLGTAQLENFPEAKAAFIRAAADWESRIKTPISVYIQVDYGTTNFGRPWQDSKIIGATATNSITRDYPSVRGNLILSASNNSEAALYSLLPQTSIPNDSGTNSGTMTVNVALARALGLVDANADLPGLRQQIGFNSNFTFDTDSSDGITPDQMDFQAVATHEIGHALGFDSANGEGGTPPLVAVWDLFRFRPGVTDFTTNNRIMSIGGGLQIFYAGGTELGLATGGPDPGAGDGDGDQSSHWRDNNSSNYATAIGIMDPNIALGSHEFIKDTDVGTLNFMGYNMEANTPPPPPPPPPPAPANNNFANAQVISECSGKANGTNIGANKEANEPSHSPDNNPGGASVWYRWQAPSTGSATITTAGSNFDTLLGVYTGNSVSALTLIQKNDDVARGTVSSRVTFNATAGTIYRIAVDGYDNNSGGDTGNIVLNWTEDNCVATPQPVVLQFGQSSYNIAEGTGSLDLLVNRSGDPSLPVTVNYATTDAANFLQNCNVTNGAATSRCDYVGVLGTLHFAANETSKTISIPIVDDTYAEGTESFSISLSNPTGGAVIGTVQTAPIQITDNGNDSAGQSNPIDNQSFFVRQHYIDFLSREPDPLSAGWITILNQCGAGDQSCRLTVSQGIYGSPEFRDRGYFIYKFYSVSLGRKPSYDEFNLDRARVSGFQTDAELEQSKVDFISDFMSRSEFANIYNGLSNNAYVQQLFTTAGVTQITVGGVVRTLSTEQQLLAGGRTRAQVLRDVAESPEVSSRFQTESTVVMHYFGYLRRDPDGAYQQWINTLNSTGDSRNVTSGFINSAEYRARFGQ